jgi:hypothetical protein
LADIDQVRVILSGQHSKEAYFERNLEAFADLTNVPGSRNFGGIPFGMAGVGRRLEYNFEEDCALSPGHLTLDRDLVAEFRLLTNEMKSFREENAGRYAST